MEKKLFVGIDPGKSGGLALINSNGDVLELVDLPHLGGEIDLIFLEELFEKYKDYEIIVMIEAVTSIFKRMRAISIFIFGKNYGILLGYFRTKNFKLMLVNASEWEKEFQLIKKDKEYSILIARQLFPKVKELLLKSKDGRAEALLIAEFSRRKELYGVRSRIDGK